MGFVCSIRGCSFFPAIFLIAAFGRAGASMTNPMPALGNPTQAADLLQRKWDRVLTAAMWTWMFLACCFPLQDTDFWWHLRTGELILERGAVPQVDLYSYTDWGQPWIDLHWGFQLFVTALYHIGGVNLLILVKAAILTVAVAVAWVAGGRNLPAWARAALWILPMVAISGRGYERPEFLSLAFLACWLWIVARLDDRPGLIWLLPLIQLVWTNCHALFVLGLVVGGCLLADHAARSLAGGRWGLEPVGSRLTGRALLWSGGLSLLACLVNPYFEEGALFPLVLYRKFSTEQDFWSHHIGEFQQPIDFILRTPGGWKQMYLLAETGVWCAAAASFACLARFRRVSVLRLLLFAGFSHLAWEANRNTNIFSLISGAIACENFADALAARGRPSAGQALGARGSGGRGSRRAGGTDSLPEVTPPQQEPCLSDAAVRSAAPDGRRRRTRLRLTQLMCAVAAGLILSVVSGEWARWGETNKSFGLGEARAWFAHDACRFAGQRGFPARAFVSHEGQAAVFIYHNAPGRLVFMDPRLEVHTQQSYQRFVDVRNWMRNADRRWVTAVRGTDGQLPAIILDSRFSRAEITGVYNTPGWRLVFADAAAAVFLEEPLANRLKLRIADPRPLFYPPP